MTDIHTYIHCNILSDVLYVSHSRQRANNAHRADRTHRGHRTHRAHRPPRALKYHWQKLPFKALNELSGTEYSKLAAELLASS